MDRPVATTLLTMCVTIATYVAMHLFVGPHMPSLPAVDVPSLAGLTPDQARALLDTRTLLLVIDGEHADERVAPGMVAEQKPLGGSRLPKGDQVHAWLARAPEPVAVPPLEGRALDVARAALTAAHLREGRVEQVASDAAPGTVAASTPSAGTSVKPETAIDLKVSSGPAAQPVPSVIGKRQSAARQLLEKAGFAVGNTSYGSSDDYDVGIVIKQNPAALSPAARATKVDLVVNE